MSAPTSIGAKRKKPGLSGLFHVRVIWHGPFAYKFQARKPLTLHNGL
jgi:hypothetical protein